MRVRRLVTVILLFGAGAAATAQLRSRRAASLAPSTPQWPPFDPRPGQPGTPSNVAAPSPTQPSTTSPVAAPSIAAFADIAPAGTPPARWVHPEDGACPEGYPIKANDNSMIFHVPGGRFYARTVAERCYADAADALADGYRAAKA